MHANVYIHMYVSNVYVICICFKGGLYVICDKLRLICYVLRTLQYGLCVTGSAICYVPCVMCLMVYVICFMLFPKEGVSTLTKPKWTQDLWDPHRQGIARIPRSPHAQAPKLLSLNLGHRILKSRCGQYSGSAEAMEGPSDPKSDGG